MDASSDRVNASSHNRVQKRDQLRQGLLNLIRLNGEGGRLPSERELSEQFDVARETLRRCLGELEREGLLERRQGAGTFVANVPVVKPLQLMSFSEDMRQRGLSPSSEVLSSRVVRAGAKLAQRLKVGPGAELIEIRRLRLADGQPMALEQVSLSRSLVPGLDPETLATRSLYEVLEQQFGLVIRSATQEIQATVLSEDEADLLDVPAFSPALLVERQVLTAQGDIVEYGKTLYRADRYRFEINVARSGVAPGAAGAIAGEGERA